MVELARGLTADALAELAALEGRVVAHDGGRLKLEWGVLRRALGLYTSLGFARVTTEDYYSLALV